MATPVPVPGDVGSVDGNGSGVGAEREAGDNVEGVRPGTPPSGAFLAAVIQQATDAVSMDSNRVRERFFFFLV